MKLEEIRALLEKVTPGPWSNTGKMEMAVVYTEVDAGCVISTCHSDRGRAYRISDAAFIALSRSLIPTLLDIAEAAEDTLNLAIPSENYPYYGGYIVTEGVMGELKRKLAVLETLK